ncbi:arginase family protein [Agromyces larvae]|uniref:Arginase family protein n=1 Tax=Agromyces larvae TaxID=2929802 RepID=A0ABY4C1Y6_9MICO|nr:arginase family protein [Agromyces larvae]UOE42790.1 arginase family protein [Agromyces larvae]
MPVDVIAAPTNLGLRPPEPGSVPGTAKAPEALRAAGLVSALASAAGDGDVVEAGIVLPGRYRADPAPGEVLRNQAALVDYTTRLAAEVDASLGRGRSPLVVGGDCSLALGPLLALRRRGRYGLVYLDGHGDFRHPGNSDGADTLGGETLAAAVGLHLDAIADLEGRRPFVRPGDVVQVGCRDDDDDIDELRAVLGGVVPAAEILADGAAAVAGRVLDVVAAEGLDGFWVHVDVDVLDPRWMPAVDSPDPVGIDPSTLAGLLALLAPHAVGADLAIYDPDLDPTGEHALTIVAVARDGLGRLGRSG